MIRVEVEKATIQSIEKKLNTLDKKMPDVLKQAINETAKQARKQLTTEAQRTYVIKTGRFNKAMTMKKATKSHLEAVIGATGSVTELKDFKVSPSKYATGEKRPSVIKAKGLRANGMKALQKGDLKAFVAKFANGHQSVVQRRGKARLPLKVFYSSSMPKMLGNEEKVFGIVGPDINTNLKLNLEKYISKALGE